MVNEKEVLHISIAIILMAIIISYLSELTSFIYALAYSIIIILLSISIKTIYAYNRDIRITHSIWKFKRYWFYKNAYFKKHIPIGLILPLLLSILSTGSIKCLLFLQYDGEAMPSKVTKRKGDKRFPNIMEWDLALISFYGLLAGLILSFISFKLNLHDLAFYSWLYSSLNMLPIGNLDGIKTFFGSKPLYILSLILIVIFALILFI